ncbi:hypothetical protein Pfo_018204 [Paulownia fortunei]|nr:hypothetical protein Pfo_018204 [Paulownia fortunei]
MGICLSASAKAESPAHTVINPGVNSIYVSSDGNDMSISSSKVSSVLVPPTLWTEGEILQSSNLKSFNFSDLKMATRDFRPDSVLGGGGFGSVFKGWIDENSFTAVKPGTGMIIAVKKLHQESFQGHREWLAEVNYLGGQVSHPHLVKLIGYCLEDDDRLLVYEFMPRGSLENHLFRSESLYLQYMKMEIKTMVCGKQFLNECLTLLNLTGGSYFQPLCWSLRLKVALGAAKGLAFLHSAETNVIYRDFKTSNILLDMNYNAKLSDFGLAKDGPTVDKSHVSIKVMGTYGYAAPEYLATGHLTAKSDVYSYGVVLLEILSGRRVIDKNRPSGEHRLVEWAKPFLANKRKVFRIMDNRLEGQYTMDVAHRVANLALRCIALEPKLRPTMDEIVKELEPLQDLENIENNHSQTHNGFRERRTRAGDAGNKIAHAAYRRPSASPPHSK